MNALGSAQSAAYFLSPIKRLNSHQRIILLTVIVSLIVQSVYIYRINAQALFLPDDAYYYFSLGRNVSDGNGPKIDTFNNTTGFQPLWGAICVLAFTLIPDDALSILCLLAISLLAEFLTAWLLYKWMSGMAFSKTAITLAVCSWVLSSLTMLNTLNGMETSLGILLVMAVYFFLKFDHPWLTGLLCGLAILARIDALILGVSITAVWVYQRRFKQIMILWLCIAATLIPWILFAASIGKPLLPESGKAVWLITLIGNGIPFYSANESIWNVPAFHWREFVSFLNFIGWNTVALYPFSLLPNLSAILVCGGIFAIIVQFRNINAVNVFALHILGLIAAYTLFIGGDWFHFRYTASIGLLFSALIIAAFYQRVSQKLAQRIYLILVSAALVFLHILFNPLVNKFHNMGLSLIANVDSFYESAVWMNENIPSTSIVGAFQTGAIGYYGDFPVLNLDGKVNNSAYIALRDKDMWGYLCRSDIKYIADWQSIIDDFLIERSAYWKTDNLILTKRITEVNIYAVNRDNCLDTSQPSN